MDCKFSVAMRTTGLGVAKDEAQHDNRNDAHLIARMLYGNQALPARRRPLAGQGSGHGAPPNAAQRAHYRT
jgi:hypothetical protein